MKIERIMGYFIISAFVIVISQMPMSAMAGERINPGTDLIYKGAFKVDWKEKSGGTKWAYAKSGMCFYPNGDPRGPADGYPGSLFSIGHPYQDKVSEFSIRVPVISATKNVNDLNTASTLQGFTDVTSGRLIDSEIPTDIELGDIQYLPKQGSQITDKLYWIRYVYYMPPRDWTTLGWSELDFSNVDSKGIWRIGDFASSATSRYLLRIPTSWADTHVGSKYLGSGRFRLVNSGSYGPSLYASAPWENGTPPSDGSKVNATQLLYYPGLGNRIDEYSFDDIWIDAAWLEVGTKSAFIVAGTKGFRTHASGLEYYGAAGPDGCGGKGYHAEPYFGQILFYDVDDLAAVAKGKMQSYEPQPYARYQFEKHLFRGGECRSSAIGGIGYDSSNNLIYILEYGIVEGYSPYPVVHVFKLSDAGKSPDRQAPTVPSNVKITAVSPSQNDISWTTSTDNIGGIMYVLYRNDIPFGITTNTSYSDTKADSIAAPVTYTVEAYDSVMNVSGQREVGVPSPRPGNLRAIN